MPWSSVTSNAGLDLLENSVGCGPRKLRQENDVYSGDQLDYVSVMMKPVDL